MVTAIRVLGCQRSYRAPWKPALHSLTFTLTLTWIRPASRWTHWVTVQREYCWQCFFLARFPLQ